MIEIHHLLLVVNKSHENDSRKHGIQCTWTNFSYFKEIAEVIRFSGGVGYILSRNRII